MKQNTEALLRQFNSLYQGYDEIYHSLSLAAGLSDSAFWILYCLLEQGDGCLQKDICACTCTSKQTIHSAICKMQNQGLIELRPGRGRNMHIHLTGAGKELARDRVLPVIRMERETFGDLAPEESRELLRLTRKYMDRFRQRAEGYMGEIRTEQR